MTLPTVQTLDFSQIGMQDIAQVGGKNASLGELFNALKPKGVGALDGFATTAAAYRQLLQEGGLEDKLRKIFSGFNPENLCQLSERGHAARLAVLQTPLPAELRLEILAAYDRLSQRIGGEPELAVRSSAAAEDLPEVSFAGAVDSFLNVRGRDELLQAVKQCFASLFTDRAINHRARLGYDQLKAALSVGVMPMVRSDQASSGVIFTLDSESGFRDVVQVRGIFGLGEFTIQGVVTPDEWIVFKPTLAKGRRAIVGRQAGNKELRVVYADGGRATRCEAVPAEQRRLFSLSDDEVLTLARWACLIEKHYSELAGDPQPMVLEWAKDGLSGQLFIVQARPETAHSGKPRAAQAEIYRITHHPGKPLATGQAVGEKIGSGIARVVPDLSALGSVQPGDVLIAPKTDPDWEPALRQVSAIVTDQGGRRAHAAIVAREFGLPCIVGTGNATELLRTGNVVTVSCAEGAEGRIYAGRIPFELERIDAANLPPTRTQVMLIVSDPGRAFAQAALPNAGVGLAGIELIVASQIGIHPLALVHYPELKDAGALEEIAARIGNEDPRDYFITRLSEGVGRIAAAFYPKPVLVRTSDFKTNEYAQLLGGREFEPEEENPLLGWRGAARYYDERYAEGFALECRALARVRDELGLTNVKVMIPFCRTIEEAKRVLAAMAANGLKQGENGLEVYAVCELPANVLLADEFLQLFDGYSIESNDLTQLVLGLDRDAEAVSGLFAERDPAVKRMIAQAIDAAQRAGKPIGICGQAASNYPDFAAWLVECGIDSISLDPDSAAKTAVVIAQAEAKAKHTATAGR